MKEKAFDLFVNKKYHCSQAVTGVFNEIIDEKTGLLIGSCFGGGMRKGEMCGAITGALMVLGMIHGYYDENDIEHKNESNKIASEFIDKFKEKFGSYNCKDIKSDRVTCAKYVEFAVEFIEEDLNEKRIPR